MSVRCDTCRRWLATGRAVEPCLACRVVEHPDGTVSLPHVRPVFENVQSFEIDLPLKPLPDPCPERGSDGYCHCRRHDHGRRP